MAEGKLWTFLVLQDEGWEGREADHFEGTAWADQADEQSKSAEENATDYRRT